ncbi:MAG TPA: FAD binding domain-containing protein [Spirochaetales bacterium]|nr:FAD binding domain-containing protein [Spirochaetales bacterium]
MEVNHYMRPQTLDEAYSLIQKGGLPVGGGCWLHMNGRSTDTMVDLCELRLDYIREAGSGDSLDLVEIGAMTTARAIETSPLLDDAFHGAFRHATEHLVGVQLRNLITIGGTVAGRYGFSDLITLLLALDARVSLYGQGQMSLGDFLAAPPKGAFLLESIVVAKNPYVSFQSLRITRNDFAVLNAAAAFTAEGWRVVVGARPAAARLCPNAQAACNAACTAAHAQGAAMVPPAAPSSYASAAAKAAAAETLFVSDSRGSADYRRLLCETLVERAITEAAS